MRPQPLSHDFIIVLQLMLFACLRKIRKYSEHGVNHDNVHDFLTITIIIIITNVKYRLCRCRLQHCCFHHLQWHCYCKL